MLNPSSAEDSSPSRPPRTWLAVVFSFLLPGLGHLYLGSYRRGTLLFLLHYVVPIALLVSILFVPAGALAALVAGLATLSSWLIRFWSCVDAHPPGQRLHPHPRPWLPAPAVETW